MAGGGGFSLSLQRQQLQQHAARAVRRSKRLLKRQPLLAKAAPTAWGFAFGDVLTQHFNNPRDRHGDYTHDFSKTAAMAAVGAAFAAPAGLALYRWMDVVWPGSGLLLATGKFTLDQVVGCAIWQGAYLAISPMYRQMAAGLLDAHHVSIPVLRPLPAAAA